MAAARPHGYGARDGSLAPTPPQEGFTQQRPAPMSAQKVALGLAPAGAVIGAVAGSMVVSYVAHYSVSTLKIFGGEWLTGSRTSFASVVAQPQFPSQIVYPKRGSSLSPRHHPGVLHRQGVAPPHQGEAVLVAAPGAKLPQAESTTTRPTKDCGALDRPGFGSCVAVCIGSRDKLRSGRRALGFLLSHPLGRLRFPTVPGSVRAQIPLLIHGSQTGLPLVRFPSQGAPDRPVQLNPMNH